MGVRESCENTPNKLSIGYSTLMTEGVTVIGQNMFLRHVDGIRATDMAQALAHLTEVK